MDDQDNTRHLREGIRAILVEYPDLAEHAVAANLLRDKTPDDPWTRPIIAQALEAAHGDPEKAWAFVKEHDPDTAEAIRLALLARDYIAVARETLTNEERQ